MRKKWNVEGGNRILKIREDTTYTDICFYLWNINLQNKSMTDSLGSGFFFVQMTDSLGRDYK